MDAHELKRVLAIVRLAGAVVQVLRPDEDSVTARRRLDLDVARARACDVELGSLQIAVEIVHVDEAVIVARGQLLTILPCHEEARHAGREALVLFRDRTKDKAVELAVVDSSVLLALGQRWQLAHNLELDLLQVARVKDIDGVRCYLSCAELLFVVELDGCCAILGLVSPIKAVDLRARLNVPN